MDPISLAIGAIGLGMQIFGGVKAADNSAQQAKVSQDEARQEQGINDLKQKQMEMDARRQQLEMIRTAQRTSALAQSRATEQGAQFGSGIQGGLAQIADQTMVNLGGVNNSLEIGRGINRFNQSISQDKIQMAALGGEQAKDQGIATMGGAFLKAGPMIGPMFKGFGGNFGSPFMGGGSPSGYGA